MWIVYRHLLKTFGHLLKTFGQRFSPTSGHTGCSRNVASAITRRCSNESSHIGANSNNFWKTKL